MSGNNSPQLRKRRLGALSLMAVGALLAGPGASLAQELEFNPRRGELSVGAGATNYLDTESPGTAFTIDAHYDYSLLPNIDVEGTLLTAVSQSADDDQATIPIIAEGGLKLNTRQYGPISLFGLAGLGYGAFLGSEELEDGLTMTMPLGGGLEWEANRFILQPRFTYRPVFGDELGGEEADADSWSAILNVGLPFI